VPGPPTQTTLGGTLTAARAASGLSLRAVERRTGIRSGHLSQIETDRIAKPELAMLWDLAALYGIDFDALVALSGHAGERETSDRQRRRMTVALRAMRDLTPAEQTEALRFMADLRARRDDG
jgi:transcriptional regulator with XRE-family HTH domain